MKTAFLCLVLLLFPLVGQAKYITLDEQIELAEDYKIKEVLQTWKLYFKKWGIDKPKPKRTKDYTSYAIAVKKWTEYYESNEGIFGGKLPKWDKNHILVAVIIYKETGIRSDQIGDLGEVGLMQVWGSALTENKTTNRKEYKQQKQKVIKNPELGIRLGTQWLAHTTTLCKTPEKWNDWSWLKPLTQYGAGPKAKVNGKCQVYSFARKRVRRTINIRKKINGRI